MLQSFFFRGAKVDTPGMSRGWASQEGLRRRFFFVPEGMCRSKVYAAGVLRLLTIILPIDIGL